MLIALVGHYDGMERRGAMPDMPPQLRLSSVCIGMFLSYSLQWPPLLDYFMAGILQK